jgi:hypothetical protein
MLRSPVASADPPGPFNTTGWLACEPGVGSGSFESGPLFETETEVIYRLESDGGPGTFEPDGQGGEGTGGTRFTEDETVWRRYGKTIRNRRLGGFISCNVFGPEASVEIAFFYPPVVSVLDPTSFSGATNPSGTTNTLTFLAESEGWYRVVWEGTVEHEHGLGQTNPFAPITESFILTPGLHSLPGAPRSSSGRSVWTATIVETEAISTPLVTSPSTPSVPASTVADLEPSICPPVSVHYRRRGQLHYSVASGIRSAFIGAGMPTCQTMRKIAAVFLRRSEFVPSRRRLVRRIPREIGDFDCRRRGVIVTCAPKGRPPALGFDFAFSGN